MSVPDSVPDPTRTTAATVDPADYVSLCPHCWGPHGGEAWFTCRISDGYYTCGKCSRRYTMPDFATKAQVKALEDECRRIGPTAVKDFTEDDLRGMWGSILREEVRASGWTWPDV